MKVTRNALGIASGLISALCVCGYLTVNKYIYTHYEISALEYSIFFAVIGGLFGLISLTKSLNKESYVEIRENLGSLAVLGVAVSLAVSAFTLGLHYTSATNAALLVTSSIVATALFSSLLLREHLTRRQWPWIFTLFIGLYVGIVGLQALHFQIGDLVVLGSVLFFGFGNAYSRVVMRRMKHPGIAPDTRLVMGAMFALILGFAVIHNYAILWTILPFAILAGFFYWLCMKTFARSIYLLNASEAVVLNSSQIFFTSIAGVLILSEHYSIEKFIGSMIVIVSVYFIAAHKRLTAEPTKPKQ